jgi:hypothetical protein
MNIKILFQCKVHIYLHVRTNSGHLVTLAENVCVVVPNNLGMIIAVSPSNTKICVSSLCWAQSATLQSGSQVTPELWVLSVELALGYLASTYNLEVALRFLVNLCTPAN